RARSGEKSSRIPAPRCSDLTLTIISVSIRTNGPFMTEKPTLTDLENRYADMIGLTPPRIAKRLKLGMQVDPDLVTALEDWRIAALTPKALDQKTVQLMSFAILLVQTSEAAT